MKIKKINIGGKEVSPFTIPSGIVMTDVKCAARLLNLVPEIGIWTTKSIGEKERIVPEGDEVLHPNPAREYGNREPILAQIANGTFVNAVRLVNPGKDKFKQAVSAANLLGDRVVNASVFGGTIREFVSVIETLDDVVDCFEGNYSCPHSEKGGMAIGTDPKAVYEFTKVSVMATKKPFLAKLTPNTPLIRECAIAAKDGGAFGVVIGNTIGPYVHSFDGHPILTSKIGGGISGRGIRDRQLDCVRQVRQAVGRDFFIWGEGGIFTAKDVEAYANAGASFFGMGSALAGMTEEEIKNYFSTLARDLENGENNAEALLKEVDMSYKKVRITEKINSSYDFKLFKTDFSLKAEPGQFVFAWLPDVGEKPFSVMDDEPLTLGILEKGEFTRKINSLNEGECFYVRGPYGNSIDIPQNSDVILVGGGCGIAGLFLLAKKFSKKANLLTFLGAKDKEHIPYLNEFRKYGKVYVSTEDGSKGIKGMVTDLFDKANVNRNSYFFNCGNKEMVKAVLPLELKISIPDKIYSSVDYMTRCGVGICGSCADEKGRRTCVEGPFISLK